MRENESGKKMDENVENESGNKMDENVENESGKKMDENENIGIALGVAAGLISGAPNIVSAALNARYDTDGIAAATNPSLLKVGALTTFGNTSVGAVLGYLHGKNILGAGKATGVGAAMFTLNQMAYMMNKEKALEEARRKKRVNDGFIAKGRTHSIGT